MMNFENILKELDAAYAILSTMLVSHDNVQKLAAAEVKLQRIYADLKAMNKPPVESKEETSED